MNYLPYMPFLAYLVCTVCQVALGVCVAWLKLEQQRNVRQNGYWTKKDVIWKKKPTNDKRMIFISTILKRRINNIEAIQKKARSESV